MIGEACNMMGHADVTAFSRTG